MFRVTVILLLAFGMQVDATELAANGASDARYSPDKVVAKLLNRALTVLSMRHADLDDMTVGKPGHVTIPQRTSLRPFLPSHITHPGPVHGACVPTYAGGAASVDTMVADPRKEGLALLLDDGTRKSHSIAENSAFVTGFFRGIAEKKVFAQLVADLYFVYKAMEDAFAATKDENVRAIDYQELRRIPSLEKDMEYYFGTNWRTDVKPSMATAKYVAQIEKVARDEPVLLIAHQYTRYLGDLFGGQMMGGMAQKSLNLDGRGTCFYEFEQIPSTKEFIDAWYTKLNSLKLTEAQKEAIVDEANNVFRLNIELFGELDGNPIAPMFRLALDALKQKLGLGS